MKRAHILVTCIILACGLSPNAKAKNILDNYLEDPSVVVRINAARGLGMIGDRRGSEILIQILEEDDADARIAALSALYDIGKTEFNSLIIELCSDENPSVRAAAYRVATVMDDTRAKEALFAGLRDESTGVREVVYPGLAKFGAYDVLQQGLRDPEPAVRIATASVMDDSGRNGMAELIKKELKKYTPEVWGRGIIALAQLGDTSSVPLFKALLEEGIGDLSIDAAEALLILDDKSGLEVLASALQSRDPFTRIHAVEVLKRHDVVELREQLVGATRDEYVSVAVLAVEALSQHDPSGNKNLFVKLMDASHPVMQIAAAAAYLRV